MKFIASAQDPQKQLVMFDKLGQGPANPAADALIPADKKRINPVDPGQHEEADRARHGLVRRELRPGARRVHEDHLGLTRPGVSCDARHTSPTGWARRC